MGWWTDLAEKHPGTPNHGGPMVEQRGMVEHIAAGSYLGTIAWQMNPTASVSSHFVVAKDGRIAQMLDTTVTAWTQRAGNGHWVSVENEGQVGDSLTPQQVEASAKLFARGHKEHGWRLQIATAPSGLGLGHHSMGAENGIDWGHSACPGAPIKAQKPAIVARAIQIATGSPTSGDDMAFIDDQNARYLAYREHCWAEYVDKVTTNVGEVVTHKGVAAVKALAADVAALKARPAAVPVALSAEDRAAIVADLLGVLKSEIRDAVADLGEGGAAQVRADL